MRSDRPAKKRPAHCVEWGTKRRNSLAKYTCITYIDFIKNGIPVYNDDGTPSLDETGKHIYRKILPADFKAINEFLAANKPSARPMVEKGISDLHRIAAEAKEDGFDNMKFPDTKTA